MAERVERRSFMLPVVARRVMASRTMSPKVSTGLQPPTRQAAGVVFWLLIAINFLNYLDRIIFVAIGPELKSAFHMNDGQVGLTGSAFLFIYTISALPLGVMADRGSRAKIVALGVMLWSLATWYTAIAHTFVELFLGRAVLGIGEASYIPAGSALIAAYFAPQVRARVMSRWSASTLVGTAAGFVAGGIIAQQIGWRWAFVICGVPGLLVAALMWRIPERRAYDQADAQAGSREMLASIAGTDSQDTARWTWQTDLRAIFRQIAAILRSPTARLNIILQALSLFVTTPAIIFIPIYLKEYFHLDVQTTALLAGGVLIPGGVLGAILGGVVADRLSRRFAGGRMLAAAVGYACALPCLVAALLISNLMLMLPFAFLATAFLNMYNGPLNAVVQDVIPGALRASAAAIIMTLAHLLGDVPSPTAIGAVESVTHMSIATSLLLFAVPALTLAAMLALWGTGIYVREMRRRAASSESDDTPPSFAFNETEIVEA